MFCNGKTFLPVFIEIEIIKYESLSENIKATKLAFVVIPRTVKILHCHFCNILLSVHFVGCHYNINVFKVKN